MSQNEAPTPDLALTVERFVDTKLRSMKNVLFGRIESYDASKRKAKIVIGVEERFWGDQTVSFPKLEEVPVVFPGSKKLKLTWKLIKDDPVIIFFSDRSMAEWLESGKLLRPGDPRQNDITDAICMPGLFPFSEVEAGETDDFALVYEETTIRVDKDGKFLLDSSDEIELKAASSIKIEATSDLEVVSTTGKFKVSVPPGAGKVSMGNGVVELLKVLSDTLGQLQIAGVIIPPATVPSPLVNAAAFGILKAQIDTLLET